MSERAANLKQDLMVGLIYPAVLGSVFYTFLDEAGGQAAALYRHIFEGSAYDVNLIVTIKFLLAFIVVAFYFCDYLYITFTNEYKNLFFVCDLVFVLTMYAAFRAIDLNGKALPSAKSILSFYWVFMALYLVWDLIELGIAKEQADHQAGAFYRRVVKWELLSIVGLMICLGSVMFVERARPDVVWVPSFLVATVMTPITWSFGLIVSAKKSLSSRYNDKIKIGRPTRRPQADG